MKSLLYPYTVNCLVISVKHLFALLRYCNFDERMTGMHSSCMCGKNAVLLMKRIGTAHNIPSMW